MREREWHTQLNEKYVIVWHTSMGTVPDDAEQCAQHTRGGRHSGQPRPGKLSLKRATHSAPNECANYSRPLCPPPHNHITLSVTLSLWSLWPPFHSLPPKATRPKRTCSIFYFLCFFAFSSQGPTIK